MTPPTPRPTARAPTAPAPRPTPTPTPARPAVPTAPPLPTTNSDRARPSRRGAAGHRHQARQDEPGAQRDRHHGSLLSCHQRKEVVLSWLTVLAGLWRWP